MVTPFFSRAAALVAVAGVLALTLAGCSTPEPEPSALPMASASARPVFASEEEALAAATEVYERYQAAVDLAFIKNSVDGLSSVATGSALTEAKESVANFALAKNKQIGTTAVTKVEGADLGRLIHTDDPASGQIYACLDVTNVDVLDSSGASIVPSDRVRVYPLLVSIVWDNQTESLFVSEESSWSGQNFC